MSEKTRIEAGWISVNHIARGRLPSTVRPSTTPSGCRSRYAEVHQARNTIEITSRSKSIAAPITISSGPRPRNTTKAAQTITSRGPIERYQTTASREAEVRYRRTRGPSVACSVITCSVPVPSGRGDLVAIGAAAVVHRQHRAGEVVPDREDRRRQRGGGAERGGGERRGEARVLHPDLDGGGAGGALALAQQAGGPVAQQVAEAVVQHHGQQHDRTGGDDRLGRARDHGDDDQRDAGDGDPRQGRQDPVHELPGDQTDRE